MTYWGGKESLDTPASDAIENVEMALDLMRFGCPFKEGGVGEYDVPSFERRMQLAATVIESFIAQSATERTVVECPECNVRFDPCWNEKSSTAAVSECKAVSYSYGGGASCEQRWGCEECGDVTDAISCPKGRK
jgi:hypothetical protein